MAKETILSYLEKQITNKIPEYDIAIEWDTRNHTIELVVRLFAENQLGALIDDAQGVTSEEAIIEFEDGILLYDPKKSKFDQEDYLAVIPFEGKMGLQQAVIDGLVDYLQVILDQGQSDLLDFLTDENTETFELIFLEKEFKLAISKYATQNYLSYPNY